MAGAEVENIVGILGKQVIRLVCRPHRDQSVVRGSKLRQRLKNGIIGQNRISGEAVSRWVICSRCHLYRCSQRFGILLIFLGDGIDLRVDDMDLTAVADNLKLQVCKAVPVHLLRCAPGF